MDFFPSIKGIYLKVHFVFFSVSLVVMHGAFSIMCIEKNIEILSIEKCTLNYYNRNISAGHKKGEADLIFQA